MYCAVLWRAACVSVMDCHHQVLTTIRGHYPIQVVLEELPARLRSSISDH
jgi:hypothetical protein